MDDLYKNAWGDTAKPSEEDVSGNVLKSQATWTSPKPSLGVHDDEADLAAPSWSTGDEIKWNEPSGDSHGFAWSNTEPDLAWGPSTYEDIQIGKPLEVSTTDDEDARLPSPVEDVTIETVTTTERVSEPPTYEPLNSAPSTFSDITPHSPVASSDGTHPSRPQSPDGFGTFTSAIEATTSPGVVISPDLEANAWGSAWESDKDADTKEEERVDEWEAARRQKEEQDRKVPPELLADILNKCEEACSKLFPEERGKDVIDVDMSSWRNNLGRGLDMIDGLEEKMQKYVPQLTLEPQTRFENTVTYQNMIKSLKLTRILPMVKQSPMSLYMSMKGSTAWESAIKGWKGASEDDVVPAGWRILEKEPASEPPAAVRPQRTSSRLFSFWGRKQASTPSLGTPFISSSAAASSSSVAVNNVATASTSSSSPRPSIDSTRSSSRAQKSASSTVASPIEAGPSTPTLPPLAERQATPPVAPTHSQSSSLASTSNLTGSYADAPLPEVEKSESAPSAVSRFLNRFSRRRSATPTNRNDSIALSSDDLAFLSDIVPSATDDDNEDLLGILSKPNKPDPLPPVLPPPPSAPPSLGASKVSPVVSSAGISSNRTPPPISRLNSPDSLFDTLQRPGMSVAERPERKGILGAGASGDFPVLSPPIPSTLLPTPASSSRLQSPSGSAPLPPRSIRPASPSPLSSVLTSSHPSSSSSSQPFAIPPPPRSRSQTPTDMPLRDHHLPHLTMLPPRAPIPSTFKSPSAASASETPLTSPTSSIPLAQLYPNMAAATSARVSASSLTVPANSSSPSTPGSSQPLAMLYPGAQVRPLAADASAQVRPSAKADPADLSAFKLPPPPSSRSITPRSSTPVAAPRTNGGVPPLLPPPAPAPSRTTATATSVPAISFDDDDFDDFQSSSQAKSVVSQQTIPPPLQPPIPLAQLLPQPVNMFPLSPSSPPPSSSNPLRVNTQFNKSTPPVPDPFDDEFADFQSSPSVVQHPSSFNIGTSSSSKQGLLPVHSSKSSGFEALSAASPTLRTPSPPRPPDKLPIPKLSAPQEDAPVHVSPTKQSRAQRHQHTLSLVETAAQRKGQWPAPAPPSPLPQAISFPPPPSSTSTSRSSGLVDLMGGDEPLGSFSSGSVASLPPPPAPVPPKLSQPNGFSLLAPTSQSTSSISSHTSGQWLFNTSMSSPAVSGGESLASSKTDTGKGTGKLSAQDLSFFEGL